MRIEEFLNVTFDESLSEPKSSSLVEDDRIDEPIVQDLNGSPSLQVNVSDEGYPKSLKEARGHPIEQVMVAHIVSISSDSSEESVGSHALRVILFGAIPAIIPVILEVPIVPTDPIVTSDVGTVLVVSPAGVFDLVDHSSSSDSDPSEDSLLPTRFFHLFSPFLCFYDSSTTFPLAPVVAPPRIRRRSATLIRPGEAIPFGRPYRTHLNGPRKLLTARKRVRPIPARRLAWRRVSHHSSDRHSSPDSSSSSSPSDHSLSGHTPPDTTDADSSTPQRFVHRSLARTPRRSEAFRRPSRKRYRSPTASVPSLTIMFRGGPIAPTLPSDLYHKIARVRRDRDDTRRRLRRLESEVVRLLDPKLKTLCERGIECIFVGYAEHSKAFMFYVIEPNKSVSINTIIESRDAIFNENIFSSIPRPSQRSLINGTEDIDGLVVPEEVTKEVVAQQPEPELRKGKRNRTLKNFGPEFQLYLIERTRGEVSN
ncbi:hypothetical protein Tco_0916919 [Tanacetum coccineum]